MAGVPCRQGRTYHVWERTPKVTGKWASKANMGEGFKGIQAGSRSARPFCRRLEAPIAPCPSLTCLLPFPSPTLAVLSLPHHTTVDKDVLRINVEKQEEKKEEKVRGCAEVATWR